MTTNDITIEPVNLKEGEEEEFKEKIKIHRVIINNLTKIDGFVWLSNKGEADQYRRRKLPQYLIAREVSNFPCYIFQSELSKAFNSISHITLKVNLMEYQQVIKTKSKNK
jgi:phosphatidylinositol-4,5-bisphosphate 3-kinase catalytic subunit alpha/beta/delta